MTPEDLALVDRYLDMMAAEFGASRHTLAAYRNDLERAAEGVKPPLSVASAAELSKLGARWAKLAPSTVARRFGLSVGRVSQLRRALREDWDQYTAAPA